MEPADTQTLLMSVIAYTSSSVSTPSFSSRISMMLDHSLVPAAGRETQFIHLCKKPLLPSRSSSEESKQTIVLSSHTFYSRGVGEEAVGLKEANKVLVSQLQGCQVGMLKIWFQVVT